MQSILKASLLALLLVACSSPDTSQATPEPMSTSSFTGAAGEVKMITLDPGHFHAALVQKNMYPSVDSVVHVYAPPGDDLQQHLQRIEQYNTRTKDPTRWTEKIRTGTDFFRSDDC